MAYKVGSNTVINDSGKLAGIGLIDGVDISGTPESGSALVYDGTNWVAGAGGKTVMKIFASTTANASANPTSWAAVATGAQYEVTTDSMLQGARAEYIVWKLNDTQVANVALANYTEGTVGGDDTVQRHRQNIDLSASPALTSVGDDNVIKAYAIDGVNNQSNTITVATTQIVAPGIAKPLINTPANNTTGAAFETTLTTQAYLTIGTSESHVSTDWQVATDPNFGSGFKVNVTANTTSKTSFAIPAGVISEATTAFYWRARFRSASYLSDWMAEGKFTTLAAVGSDGQPYAGGVVANSGLSVVYATAGSYTFTVPAVDTLTVSVVGAGGSGGASGQPDTGGGGGGSIRATFDRQPTAPTSAAISVGESNNTGPGSASTFTYNGSTIIAGGGQNPVPTTSGGSTGGTVSVGFGTAQRSVAGGAGGSMNTPGQPGGAGGGAGGHTWSMAYPQSAGGNGTGWYGGGGGGGGGVQYNGSFSPSYATAGGSGAPPALGGGFAGGAGSGMASPGTAGGGPSGGQGGPGGGSMTPAHAGGGGGGSYGGGGGYTAGWFGSRPEGADGYVRIDWATGETT